MFPSSFFAPVYFAPRYFPRNGETPVPSDEGGGATSGHPWPRRLLNILFPRMVRMDDDDVLFVLEDL